MLDISNAVHAQHFSALMMFALAGNPRKPIGGPHWKARHSSGAIMSFIAVLHWTLFMTQLDLWVSATGSVKRNKAEHCTTHGEM
jgi:hypothetical protein